MRGKLDDGLNSFMREAVLADLVEWEDQFRGKTEKEMKRRREKMGLDFTEMELEKRVKIIGNMEMNEQ